MDKRGITRNLPILQSQAQKYDEILFSQWEKSTINKMFKFKKKKFYEIEKKPEAKQIKKFERKLNNNKKEVTCYNCQKKGHMAKDCRSPKKPNPQRNNGNRQINRQQLGTIAVEFMKKTKQSKTPVYKTPGSAGADLWSATDTTVDKYETKTV